MDLQLEGKRALVTGSSAGIGEGIAKALATEGVAVVVHGRKEEEANRVVDEIQTSGGKAFVAIGDLSTDEGGQKVAQTTVSVLGGVDILVNNAGIFSPQRSWLSTSAQRWNEIYNINVVSMVRMIQLVIPPMKATGWGRIIQISSASATQPPEIGPDYSATKAANVNMTVSLSKELAGTGITVNTVSPGPIVTPGFQQLFREMALVEGQSTDWNEIEKNLLEERFRIPSGRLGRVEDVGNAVAFLASPLAGFVNGANIHVDGGLIS